MTLKYIHIDETITLNLHFSGNVEIVVALGLNELNVVGAERFKVYVF